MHTHEWTVKAKHTQGCEGLFEQLVAHQHGTALPPPHGCRRACKPSAAAGVVGGRHRCMGVHHGRAGGRDAADPIRAVYDGLEVYRCARELLLGCARCLC